MTEQWDAVVIGASAAGLSAALMLGRARRRVLVVDDGQPRNRFAARMHAVVGNDGAPPSEFAERGRAEAERYGARFLRDRVERVDERESELKLETTLRSGRVVRSRAVVVATGVEDALPEVPGLAQRWGVTVLHCPYCHGWEVRDRRIGVLTTSPAGLHQAQLVRQWSQDVVVFTAGLGEMDAASRARLRSRGIELVDSPVVEVVGSAPSIDAVRTADGRLTSIDALFTAAALAPRDGFLTHLGLERADTPVGSFLAVDAMGRTSSERIWAAGNVTNPMANVPIAMAAGATAGAMVNAALVTEDFDAAVEMAGVLAGDR